MTFGQKCDIIYVSNGGSLMAIAHKTKKKNAKMRAKIRAKRVDEPIVTEENYKEDFSNALQWYMHNWEDKDSYTAMQAFIKQNKMKGYAQVVTKSNVSEYRVAAKIAQLLMREQHVELDSVIRMYRRLADLKLRKIEDTPVEEKPKATVSIQDRMLTLARTHAGEFDGRIDEFRQNKYKSDFSAKSYLVNNQVSGPVAKKIGDLYAPLVTELTEVLMGKDPQLKEGYSHASKREMKRYLEFVNGIVTDCDQQAVSAKSQRKQRASKPKSPLVIVNKMKYMKEYPDLNLVSISPTKILDAEELWVYVPEKRKLVVLYAAGGTLGVHRTAVTNYDVATSAMKTLRDPEKFFKSLSSTGKRAMANAWKSIKGKELKAKARITDKMLLVAAN